MDAGVLVELLVGVVLYIAGWITPQPVEIVRRRPKK